MHSRDAYLHERFVAALEEDRDRDYDYIQEHYYIWIQVAETCLLVVYLIYPIHEEEQWWREASLPSLPSL